MSRVDSIVRRATWITFSDGNLRSHPTSWSAILTISNQLLLTNAGAAFLINEYYTRAQMSIRYAFFFCFGTLGPCISGVLAYGIRNLHGISGLEGFRWIFVIEGLLTILISVFVFTSVPDFPERTKILTASEREHLLQVLQQDKGSQKLDLKKVDWLKTMTDYKIWFP